jgi:nifR3 family TIM-barrel protein
VDINMGCPVHKVTRGGGGSALLCNPTNTVTLVKSVVDSVRLPVTVKMRLGWDDANLSAAYFARAFEQAGVAGLTIHGRTREQGFGGQVNRAGIRLVVAAVDAIPVIGNGDIRGLDDAARMFDETGCAGIAIGRGALLNPWIFSQLCDWERTGEAGPRPGFLRHLEFMDRHFKLLVGQRAERFACLTFRKVANWYCRVLRPGREAQQRLIRLESVDEFDAIVGRLRETAAEREAAYEQLSGSPIPVPGGPISHW